MAIINDEQGISNVEVFLTSKFNILYSIFNILVFFSVILTSCSCLLTPLQKLNRYNNRQYKGASFNNLKKETL